MREIKDGVPGKFHYMTYSEFIDLYGKDDDFQILLHIKDELEWKCGYYRIHSYNEANNKIHTIKMSNNHSGEANFDDRIVLCAILNSDPEQRPLRIHYSDWGVVSYYQNYNIAPRFIIESDGGSTRHAHIPFPFEFNPEKTNIIYSPIGLHKTNKLEIGDIIKEYKHMYGSGDISINGNYFDHFHFVPEHIMRMKKLRILIEQ